jgi:hypothetical protein
MDESVSGEHKKLLSDLIARLEREELAEYKSASTFHYWMWHVCAGAAFLASLVSGALASFISDSTFATYGKVVLAVLSFVSAGATGLISLDKFREKEALREEGRIEMQDIVDNAKSLLIACKTDEECGRVFHAVREPARVLSMNQHRRDIALRSDELPKIEQG